TGDGQPITNSAFNSMFPTVDDAGNVVFFRDGGSGGVGWQVIARNAASGAESVVEFSSRNVFLGTVRERRAGRQTGIASNGKIIWYYDFYDPYPFSVVRRFNVGGLGNLGPVFYPYDHPDININKDFIYPTSNPATIVKSNALNLAPRLITDGT